jgi:beta-glucosidase
VHLEPGASEEVAITAEPRVLADWDAQTHGFIVAGGRYKTGVARSAGTLDLTIERDLDRTTMSR